MYRTAIASEAFNSCSILTAVTFPSTLTSIGSYAFQWCSKLTSISIPDGVTVIDKFPWLSLPTKAGKSAP
ncbi:MAG: leucine-rich repeat protein [Muribaculaceae bacterium]|nr:leucine-rich repeat protein [Muribaculaceae bacterium]